MKRKGIVKIIFILAIILIAGFIKTTSCLALAWNDNNIDSILDILKNGEKVLINRSDLKTSNYIFCRDYGTHLSDGSSYGLDPAIKNQPKTYPIITYYTGEFSDEGEPTGSITTSISSAKSFTIEGADIAYILGSFEDNSKSANSYGPVQKAYWKAIGQLDTLDEEALQLYNKSQVYKNYLSNVIKHQIKYQQEQYAPVITTTNSQIETLEDNVIKVGPLNIDYARILGCRK